MSQQVVSGVKTDRLVNHLQEYWL